MDRKFLMIPAVLLITLLATSDWAEARIGGGRSFGSRGSRGMAPRTYSAPYRGSQPYSAPTQPQAPGVNPYGRAQPSGPIAGTPGFNSGGGGFMRGMLGGLAGGFIGSMLFRSMGYGAYGPGMAGHGGIGLLEILLIGGILFFIFRLVMSRAAVRAHANSGAVSREMPQYYDEPKATGVHAATLKNGEPDEWALAETIRRYDGAFDLTRFKEARVDDFFMIQSAWMRRDLGPIKGMISTEIADRLESEVAAMKAEGRVNHIENVAVRDSQVVEAWQELGREYVTVRFHANLLDYTTDERTGQVVAGDKNRPVKFEEFWTYSREVGSSESPWKLTAIEQVQ